MLRILLMALMAMLFIHGCAVLPPVDPSAYLNSTETAFYKRIAFDRSGTYLAAHDILRGRLDVYRTSDLRRIASRKLKMRQTATLLFSPDAWYLAVDSEKRDIVEIWRIGSEETLALLSCGKPKILTQAFSTGTDSFTALCADGTLRRWETGSWRPIATEQAPAFWGSQKVDKYTPLSFSSDGDTLIIPNHRIVLWNIETG